MEFGRREDNCIAKLESKAAEEGVVLDASAAVGKLFEDGNDSVVGTPANVAKGRLLLFGSRWLYENFFANISIPLTILLLSTCSGRKDIYHCMSISDIISHVGIYDMI